MDSGAVSKIIPTFEATEMGLKRHGKRFQKERIGCIVKKLTVERKWNSIVWQSCLEVTREWTNLYEEKQELEPYILCMSRTPGNLCNWMYSMKRIEWNAFRNCHSSWVDQLTAMGWPSGPIHCYELAHFSYRIKVTSERFQNKHSKGTCIYQPCCGSSYDSI